jgi:hypothetical protein
MVRRFQCAPHTNSDWLNPDTLLDVRALWVIGIFALEDSLSAQGIDEGGTAWRLAISARHGCTSGLSELYQFLKHRRPSNRTEYPS